MTTERKKGCWRGMDPDEQIEAALRYTMNQDVVVDGKVDIGSILYTW